MKKLRFPIESDLLELLVAFEDAASLSSLSKVMCRDPSVISRSLARLGENRKILTKKDRKWSLTPSGAELVEATKAYVEKIRNIIEIEDSQNSLFPANACLMIVNAQMALQSPSLGKSSNPLAIKNIELALSAWRQNRMPIIHAKHVSKNPESSFFAGLPGVEFMAGLEPLPSELVIDKSRPSAFLETELAKALDKAGSSTIALAGFTAHECIDATAKHAVALGLNVWIIEDAIAQFDVASSSGRTFAAADVHEIVMTGLSPLATLASTRHVVSLAEK